MDKYYGAKTTAGELIVMSISDLEPAALQEPEQNGFLANVDLWEPLPDDYSDPSINEWYTLDELMAYLKAVV